MKFLRSAASFLRATGRFIFCFRKLFLAIPVIAAAIWLAQSNAASLPEQVGLILSEDGTFSLLLSRQQAVYGPLIVTGGCLVCMFASRKAFYPWLISVLTLALPPLILLLNQFGF